MSSAAQRRKQALAQLREGKKRSEQYEVAEAAQVIEEVDDAEYEKVVKQRIRDDFIVDDGDDQGYGEDGGELWDSEDEQKAYISSFAKKRSAGQRGLESFLGVGGTAGNSIGKSKAVTENLDALLDGFEGELEKAASVGIEPVTKKVKLLTGAPAFVSSKALDPGTQASVSRSAPIAMTPKQEPPTPVKIIPTEPEIVQEDEPVEPDMVDVKIESSAFGGWSIDGGAAQETQPTGPLDSSGKSIEFFYIDAFEENGIVHLFGKVPVGGKSASEASAFASCCLLVKHVPRNVFLLLRNQEEGEDGEAEGMRVFQEFESLRKSGRAPFSEIKKYAVKPVKRNYCFEAKGVPHGRLNFLKISYSSEYPTLPENLSGDSFSHCFGASTSLLELLLIKRKIMGPSWLEISGGQILDRPIASWCNYEVNVTGIKGIRVLENQPPAPPISILSLSMKTVLGQGKQHEIVLLAANHQSAVRLDWSEKDLANNRNQQSFVICRPPEGKTLSRRQEDELKSLGGGWLQLEPNERSLISCFLAKMQKLDPDVIIGHNSYGFDIDVLSARISKNSVGLWHRLSRLRRPKIAFPNKLGSANSMWTGRQVTAGRLVCDTYLSAREYLRESTYELSHLSAKLLGADRIPFELEALPRCFDDAGNLVALARHTLGDAILSLRIAWNLQVLPLTKQLTNLAGNLWSHSLQNKRAERNEYLLVHEFHRKKFVVPDKINKRANANQDLFEAEEGEAQQAPGKSKAAYAGGLVLDPKVGLYDKFVVLLDFNSLYPSIIREFNICFTTVDRGSDENPDFMPELPSRAGREGVLPSVITRLVESRKAVKNLQKSEKDPLKQLMLDIRQKALKLTANSMYGCLGFNNSRFYAKPVAALITHTGRKNLQATVDLVEQQMRLDVVYGDTDSIFVHSGVTDYAQAISVGRAIAKEVNKRYAKLEIDIDGVFKKLLLLKKKKYAAVKIVDWETRKFEVEYKGLDIVRRDWSVLSKKTGDRILREILLSEMPKEQVTEWLQGVLTELAGKMDRREIPIEDFCITKGLTKLPHEYPDAKNQPHVLVAKRMIEKGELVRAGNEIPYVIIEGEGSVPERARSLIEAKKENLAVDIGWYKAQQIHPPISRLVCPTEIIDSARIAECLGLDGAKFVRDEEAEKPEEEDSAIALAAEADVEEKYANLKQKFRVHFSCYQCGDKYSAAQLVKCLNCPKCQSPWFDAFAKNFLRLTIRDLQAQAYAGLLVCDEDSCGKAVKQPMTAGGGCRCPQPECSGKLHPEISPALLHQHVCFVRDLCSKYRPGVAVVAEGFVELSAYDVLDKGTLFRRFKLPPTVRSG